MFAWGTGSKLNVVTSLKNKLEELNLTNSNKVKRPLLHLLKRTQF